MRFALYVILILTLCTGASIAQSGGLDPLHNYDLGPFDATDLSGNGVVSLHIPLISYKQRGTLPALSMSLIYKSNGWHYTKYQDGLITGCDPDSPTCYNYHYTWELDAKHSGVQVIAEPEYRRVVSVTPTNDTGGEIISESAVESGGTGHQLAPATDDSGLLALDASNISVPASNGIGTIIDAHGIHYEQWCDWGTTSALDDGCYAKTISDPSGNVITAVSSGGGVNAVDHWIDSVGRNIPGPPLPPGPYGGPHGDQCITRNYPGPNNASVSVQFCYSTYLFQTSFIIPSTAPNVYQGGGWVTALSSVILPSGQKWLFSYNSWGELQTVTSPLGAIMTYDWRDPIRL
jgi:YD repeat-containing protein